ncbi:peptidyl-prolyl cis-trans isomerase, EpsD family [Pseudoduganella sp. FT93W]|uniref:peptidylprolyl isomerase n=2 Tax=Duganella fentianensis TaxID=2692177 RepID=A0A845I6Y1_9BURK|nr:peptidyl-prolyl cis-trans isomerase, EpsD family [Duganella fentianensis]
MVLGLSACSGKKESKPGQALASVNGEEITILQLNDELQRANVPTAQQEAASTQILESLIDRQLVLNEAVKEKLDRDPQIVRTIERAKSMLLAQAYLQKKVGTPARPTRAEVEAYYNQHPGFFSARKVFEMRQLVMASKDISPDVKAAIDSVKTLEEAATWLDEHKVGFTRAQLVRASSDLPVPLTEKLLGLSKGQLFIINEGERSLLVTITDVKDAPATLAQAAPQIEQFLINKKGKDIADAELARLRTAAKIEYLNGRKAPAKAEAAPAAAASEPAAAKPNAEDQNARGVAGLK